MDGGSGFLQDRKISESMVQLSVPWIEMWICGTGLFMSGGKRDLDITSVLSIDPVADFVRRVSAIRRSRVGQLRVQVFSVHPQILRYV